MKEIKTNKDQCPMSTTWIGDFIMLALLGELPKHFDIKPKEPELKPCPFCGNAPDFIDNFKNKLTTCTYKKAIVCKSCGLSMVDYMTKEELIEAWNKRV